MTLKMWVKSKFVLFQPRYYNLFTEKKIHVFEVLFLLKTFRYCQSQEILFKYIFGKLYIFKFIYFGGRPHKVK